MRNAKDMLSWALANGAKVEIDGRTINGNRRTHTASEPVRLPVPVERSESDRLKEILEGLKSEIEEETAKAAQRICEAVAANKPAEPPAKPKEWILDVEYNEAGRFSRIIAKPVY